MLIIRPLPCATHMRRDCACHANQAKEIGVEDGPSLIERAVLRCGRSNAEAGIVHERIDATFQADHVPDDGSYNSSLVM